MAVWQGIGFHMSGILIDSPKLATDEDMLHFLQLWPGIQTFMLQLVRARDFLHAMTRTKLFET